MKRKKSYIISHLRGESGFLLISKYQIPCLIVGFSRNWEVKREEVVLVDKNTSLQTIGGVGEPSSKRDRRLEITLEQNCSGGRCDQMLPSVGSPVQHKSLLFSDSLPHCLTPLQGCD